MTKNADNEEEVYYGGTHEDGENNELAAEYELSEESDTLELSVLGTYSGQRNSKNERHGFGKALLPNGDVYVGTYQNGLRHGFGTYKFKNGAKYHGCYKEGFRHGRGVMRYPNKTVYKGSWSKNQKNGDGDFKYENNDTFSGSWKCDMKHGVGTYTFCKTKVVLKGMWLNDKKVNGFQIFYPTNNEGSSGFTFYGNWDKDESITGDGYFVFDGLSCMQKGEHVENPFHAESTAALENNNRLVWRSRKILPIVRSILPRQPVKRPMVIKASSCEINVSTPNFPATSDSDESISSQLEDGRGENLSTEMNKDEIEAEFDAHEMKHGVEGKPSDYRSAKNEHL